MPKIVIGILVRVYPRLKPIDLNSKGHLLLRRFTLLAETNVLQM
jgi:hypothetical protein